MTMSFMERGDKEQESGVVTKWFKLGDKQNLGHPWRLHTQPAKTFAHTYVIPPHLHWQARDSIENTATLSSVTSFLLLRNSSILSFASPKRGSPKGAVVKGNPFP